MLDYTSDLLIITFLEGGSDIIGLEDPNLAIVIGDSIIHVKHDSVIFDVILVSKGFKNCNDGCMMYFLE